MTTTMLRMNVQLFTVRSGNRQLQRPITWRSKLWALEFVYPGYIFLVLPLTGLVILAEFLKSFTLQ